MVKPITGPMVGNRIFFDCNFRTLRRFLGAETGVEGSPLEYTRGDPEHVTPSWLSLQNNQLKTIIK